MTDEKPVYNAPSRFKAKCVRLMRNGTLSLGEVAQRSGVTRPTLYNWAKEAGVDLAMARHKRADRLWEQG